MAHSIFVREIVNGRRKPPQLLAYDIGSQHEARNLVQGIATSYKEHGEHFNSGLCWFKLDGKTYELYCWDH
jgi:hypothetical protein